MKIRDFKKHTITRSTPPVYSRYADYKPYLRSDFCSRCAYCNLHDDTITTPFEVDHFVPRDTFKNVRAELDTDYRNLIYACKKCNIAKSNQFQGDINSECPTNELFYDPVLIDYNDIYYRNNLGAIASDDDKGKNTIVRLKLYRPIHILAWLCEELYETADRLEKSIDMETNEERKAALEAAYNKINAQYRKLSRLFSAAYNDANFTIEDVYSAIP